jgi:hypothetical protein
MTGRHAGDEDKLPDERREGIGPESSPGTEEAGDGAAEDELAGAEVLDEGAAAAFSSTA